MKPGLGVILGLVGVVWLFWAVTFSGFTVFLYLATGDSGWDAHLSYALSVIGVVPIIGGIVATFMADSVHGWGFFEAAFNLIGYLIPLGFAGYLNSSADQRRKRPFPRS